MPARPEPAAPNDAELRRGLRRMRTIATGLLALVVVVYVVFWRWESGGGPTWAGYVRAAAEAGAVGALADWFAVTALFRRPLGLPIPHTAIIPNRKNDLGRSLERFVAQNFLAEPVIREKIAGLGVAMRMGAWLGAPGHAEWVAAEASGRLAAAISGIRDDVMLDVVEKTILARVMDRPWAPAAGTALGRIVAGGLHHRLVDLVAVQAEAWLRDNPEIMLRIVTDKAPSWSPRFVDEAIAARAYAEALRFISEVRADPDHRLRRALDDFLARFAEQLRTDPATAERVEKLKERIRDHPEVDLALATMWNATKAILIDAADDPGGVLRTRMADELRTLGERLTAEPRLGAGVDAAANDIVAWIVNRYRSEITAVISETVANWEPTETSTKIELHVGRDLQYIRINGTVVGAIAGLVIHLLTSLLL
ncbi:DUF445 domain-containing protein [Frankia sp. CIT1]|uniref:DUF445 domain-containing protein n=1 Tax=Frankia sp. CIT1 TaxID=2880974 RepID=UPI001EF4DF54|nr:DUF445 domain-containing protein [Frankia sp. CIT1]